MPKYSPRVSPYSTSINGILFLAASPLTSLTQLASEQFLARMTYLALSFQSGISQALQTSWSPLARSESLLQVWMILLRAASQSTTGRSVIFNLCGDKYYINQSIFYSKIIDSSLQYIKMELRKQNIVSITISQDRLNQNFFLIEQQFKKMYNKIEKLTMQSNLVIDKMNEIDPFDQIQNYLEQCQIQEIKDRENFQGIKQKQINPSVSQIDHKENIENQSKTDVQVKNQLQKMDQRFTKKKQCYSRDSFGDKSRISRKNQPNDKSNAGPQHKNFRIMHENLIKDLDQRLTQLEAQKQQNLNKILILTKQNENIKGYLGIKKKQKTPKSKPLASIIKKSVSIKQMKDKSKQQEQNVDKSNTNSSAELESVLQQNNFITQFSKQLEIVKEILRDKSLLIDHNFQKITDIINENSLKINGEVNCLNEKLQQLQDRDKDVSLMIAQNNRSTKSNYTSHTYNRNTKSSFQLNDTIQSYKNYYEDKIVEIFQQMDKLRGEYINIIDKMSEESNNGTQDQESIKQMERIKNIAQKLTGKSSKSNDDKIRKQMSSVKRDLKKIRQEFDNLMGGINSGSNQTRTLIIKPNETKQDWKNLSQKIFKLRQQLMGYIKELESKIFTNNQIISLTHELQIGLSQCKILINKKVSNSDFQKTSKRIQNRLNNFIKQIYQKQGISQEQQALLAKQPWFCLSCDGEIKNQTGKIGKTLYVQKMPGKKVNPQSHMVRRNDNISRLPNVHN